MGQVWANPHTEGYSRHSPLLPVFLLPGQSPEREWRRTSSRVIRKADFRPVDCCFVSFARGKLVVHFRGA
jgi:hypothetical protein